MYATRLHEDICKHAYLSVSIVILLGMLPGCGMLDPLAFRRPVLISEGIRLQHYFLQQALVKPSWDCHRSCSKIASGTMRTFESQETFFVCHWSVVSRLAGWLVKGDQTLIIGDSVLVDLNRTFWRAQSFAYCHTPVILAILTILTIVCQSTTTMVASMPIHLGAAQRLSAGDLHRVCYPLFLRSVVPEKFEEVDKGGCSRWT